MPAASIVINNEIYDIPSNYAQKTSLYLTKIWEGLGRPSTLEVSESLLKGSRAGKESPGTKMLSIIIDTWRACFPYEYQAQCKLAGYNRSLEKDIKSHVKGGGYNTVSYPRSLFNMIRAVFPQMKLGDKKIKRKLAKMYPWLKITKYKI